MNKLYIREGSAVMFDPETNKMSGVRKQYTDIRSLYYIQEEADLFAEQGETKFEAHVVPGDIVINFYRGDKPNTFLIIKNDEWKANIEADIEREQKEKEAWAAKNKVLDEFTPQCEKACDACDIGDVPPCETNNISL